MGSSERGTLGDVRKKIVYGKKKKNGAKYSKKLYFLY